MEEYFKIYFSIPFNIEATVDVFIPNDDCWRNALKAKYLVHLFKNIFKKYLIIFFCINEKGQSGNIF